MIKLKDILFEELKKSQIDLLREATKRVRNINNPNAELKKLGVKYNTLDDSNRFEWVYKLGKKKVAYYQPGPKTLLIIVPDKAPKEEEITPLVANIDKLLQEWVISSLDDHSKRSRIAKQLIKLNIPSKYKSVPNSTMWRIVNTDSTGGTIKLSKKGIVRSWAYHLFGIEKMDDWYNKIYGNTGTKAVIKKRVQNVLICLPTFYSYHEQLLKGRNMYSNLISSEYEVICFNRGSLLTAKEGEYTVK